MSTIAMILRRAPYGDINAAEAVRYAMGGISDDLNVDLLLVDSGVLLAKKGQNDIGTGLTNLGNVLKDCIDMGVSVYADKLSMQTEHMDAGDIIDGVKVVSGSEIAEIVKGAKTTMIF